MKTDKVYFGKLDFMRFLVEVTGRSDSELVAWVRELAQDLAMNRGQNELAADILQEALHFRQVKAEAGAKGGARKAAAMRQQSDSAAKAEGSTATAQDSTAIAEATQTKPNQTITEAESALVVVGGAGGETLPAAAARKVPIEERRAKFGESLQPFLEQFGRETLGAFFAYWTEPNPSKTKLRFELERTWETSRRLSTWAAREKPAAVARGRGAANLSEVKAYLQGGDQ